MGPAAHAARAAAGRQFDRTVVGVAFWAGEPGAQPRRAAAGQDVQAGLAVCVEIVMIKLFSPVSGWLERLVR